MDINSAAQVIRDTVSMQQILDLYGYTVKNGFMVCPFHGDTDPSMKIYTGRNGHSGWHCFGCQRGGSVIDFVKEHEGCNFPTAVRAIDNALHMGLFPPREDPYQLEEQRRVQKWLDEYVAVMYGYCDLIRKQIQTALERDTLKEKLIREKEIRDRSAQEWTFLETFEENCKYNEYLLSKVDEFKEEVAAWRRKARRARSA